MITISINRASDQTLSARSRHRSLHPFEAVQKAIRKEWGNKATLKVDRSISLPLIGVWYGQVVRPGGSCITGVLRIEANERVPNGGWDLKSAAGHYAVWQAGPNAYRLVHFGNVFGWYSHFGDASAEAGRLYRIASGK